MPISKADYDAMLARCEAGRKKAPRNGSGGSSGNLPARLPAAQPEPPQGEALERPVPRKEASQRRYKISFHVFAVRPCDWDNYHCKELQDMVVQSGIIPGDDYQTLQGEVIPYKVSEAQFECTRIVIEQLP